MLRRRSIISLVFIILIVVIAPSCSNNETSSGFKTAQQKSLESNAVAVSEDTISGGELNRYFPNNKGAYKVIYTQEKNGLAQAKLKRDGQELALMSISDIANNPTAIDKFQDYEEMIQNYPVIEQGDKATAMLVKNRFQIKIISRSDLLKETDRKHWLKQFDLTNLAQLE